MFSNSNNEDEVLPIYNNTLCTLCNRVMREVIEVPAYYNNGRNMRLAMLCYSADVQRITQCCWFKYLSDLGINDLRIENKIGPIQDRYQHAYDTILSIFISSP